MTDLVRECPPHVLIRQIDNVRLFHWREIPALLGVPVGHDPYTLLMPHQHVAVHVHVS